MHGLIDDNVHFQDAARLVQKLIELEKPFEVMVYPTERHTIETEASRFDYDRRVVDFFDAHLRKRRTVRRLGRAGDMAGFNGKPVKIKNLRPPSFRTTPPSTSWS